MTLPAALIGLTIPHPILLAIPVVAAGAAVLLARRVELRRSVVIHAPPGRIWEAVRHLPTLQIRHGRSTLAATAAAWSLRRGDGAAPGSVWRLAARRGAGDADADFEVLEADPGHTLVYRMVPGGRGARPRRGRHRSTLVLEAIDDGATRLSYRLEARGPALRVRHWFDPDRLRADLFDLRLRSIRNEVERGDPWEAPAAGRTAAGRAGAERPAEGPRPGAARGDAAPPDPAPPTVPRPPESTL